MHHQCIALQHSDKYNEIHHHQPSSIEALPIHPNVALDFFVGGGGGGNGSGDWGGGGGGSGSGGGVAVAVGGGGSLATQRWRQRWRSS